MLSIQLVLMPVGITVKTTDEERKRVIDSIKQLAGLLENEGQLRVEVDLREGVTPGWKYNYWELKGVPIRLEIGPKELAKHQALSVIRYTGEKRPLPRDDIVKSVKNLLDEIHIGMYER